MSKKTRIHPHKIVFMLAVLYTSLTQGEWRDPTMPPPNSFSEPNTGTIIEQTPLPKVTAIWNHGRRRYALIDGTTVKTGDTLANELTILKINAHSVIVRYQDAKQTLSLIPALKKPVK